MALGGSTQVRTVPLGDGDAGVMQTLALMSQLVERDMTVPRVVETARQLAVAQGAGSEYRTALTIRAWLARVWRFVGDPVTREHLEDADYLLRQYEALSYVPGDCDEAAILGATLGKAVGIFASWTVLGFEDGTARPRYSHVFATLYPNDGPAVSLDVTRPMQTTARVVRSYTVGA